MKILHIINDLSSNGGAQRFLVDLVVQRMPQYKIRVLILNPDNDFEEKLKESEVTCYVWKSLSLIEKWKILQWPDLVHSHLFPSIYLALFSFGKRKIQTEHNTTNRRRDYPLFKFMEHLLYMNNDKTICITHKVQEALVKFIPAYKDRYEVIFNGVDLHRFSRQPKLYKALEKKGVINIGMVGRLHHYKDHDTLICAIAKLPENYHLHLAGDGEKKQVLRKKAKDLNCDHRIHWYGITSDIPRFLSSLDLYVQSSKVEGFGLAAVEAMAEGLPVLGSDVPGLNEVIGDKTYLFKQGQSDDLITKILHIVGSKSSYEAASCFFVERCNQFTLNNFRNSYYKIYDELCTDK
ncbi:glycosyltransferase [Vibrio sp. 665]|uniref:glycosyltransferase n=1 Tax=Vibrio TaxID=662 RepID=UPI001BD4E177|nr:MULTISPECIES: glycosyltransferase [Vibrio]MBS9876357.1 glycosyltransferase [Vibrio alginolyticus]MDW2021956.1 glycosyltransferase [Vibrio sp. 397]MDW2026915.1 glycosyltransferase [Vibrio sp. 399]MDW2030448.1 glycosyltransferase [Vibrio sp. 665]MDW2213093.1 glycosyltransferase [Vibrio sp. 1982]